MATTTMLILSSLDNGNYYLILINSFRSVRMLNISVDDGNDNNE